MIAPTSHEPLLLEALQALKAARDLNGLPQRVAFSGLPGLKVLKVGSVGWMLNINRDGERKGPCPLATGDWRLAAVVTYLS